MNKETENNIIPFPEINDSFDYRYENPNEWKPLIKDWNPISNEFYFYKMKQIYLQFLNDLKQYTSLDVKKPYIRKKIKIDK